MQKKKKFFLYFKNDFCLLHISRSRRSSMGHFRVAVCLGFEVLVLNYLGNGFDLHKK